MGSNFDGRVTFSREIENPELLVDGGFGVAATAWVDGNSADIRVGGSGESGDIRVYSSADSLEPTVHIDGFAGDIRLLGGDCAEMFESAERPVAPGSVVVLDESGLAIPSQRAYDPTAIGVSCGAGGFKPGVILGYGARDDAHVTIAVAGRVFCLADASQEPIDPGDLLTTSETPGHAMKATDRARAWGAVIGKSTGTLRAGKGLVPMLVMLR